MEKEHLTEEQPEVHYVWIGEQERIASFHPIDTYRLHVIKDHNEYVNFLQMLQEQGFRFQ